MYIVMLEGIEHAPLHYITADDELPDVATCSFDDQKKVFLQLLYRVHSTTGIQCIRLSFVLIFFIYFSSVYSIFLSYILDISFVCIFYISLYSEMQLTPSFPDGPKTANIRVPWC